MPTVTIHTDGACSGNPGPGGWAAILRGGTGDRELSGGEPLTTNNRMELLAAIEGLRAVTAPGTIDLFTDSVYVRDGITKWLARWKRNGWRTTTRQPVKNADLWHQLDEVASRHRVTWHWVKGHAGQPNNERCDQLARDQIARVRQLPIAEPSPARVPIPTAAPVQAELPL